MCDLNSIEYWLLGDLECYSENIHRECLCIDFR